VVAPSQPTTGIDGCCARAASGQAATAPPMSVMKSRRFTGLGPRASGRKDSTPQLRQELLRCGISIPAMSPSGQSLPKCDVRAMSALPR
jgi:hypothetical protein